MPLYHTMPFQIPYLHTLPYHGIPKYHIIPCHHTISNTICTLPLQNTISFITLPSCYAISNTMPAYHTIIPYHYSIPHHTIISYRNFIHHTSIYHAMYHVNLLLHNDSYFPLFPAIPSAIDRHDIFRLL